MKTMRRGYLPEYDTLFNDNSVKIMREAAIDALFLMNRGYHLKRAVHIAMEHYLLTEMQRLALSRGLDPDKTVALRAQKRLSREQLEGKTVYIDGFNAIILMESVVSHSPVFRCRDMAIRDLANLKGSYKIIDKTEPAIRLILSELDLLKVEKAIIHIDSPVSNSRNLKVLICSLAKEYHVDVEVHLIDACDISFYDREYVISGDSIILDNVKSWAPFYSWIIEDYQKTNPVWLIDFYNMDLSIH